VVQSTIQSKRLSESEAGFPWYTPNPKEVMGVDNKLIEKRTYYFGIYPGFDVCHGNYIYRYEY